MCVCVCVCVHERGGAYTVGYSIPRGHRVLACIHTAVPTQHMVIHFMQCESWIIQADKVMCKSEWSL